MRTALKYSAMLIGLYLLVVAGSNSGTVINDTTQGAAGLVKAFQGR